MYDFRRTLQVLSVVVPVRQNQPRYLTLLLTSALGHLRLVPDKHCPICVSSVVSPSALIRLITQSSIVKTLAHITHQISVALVQRKHGVLQKAVDCYVTLMKCSMTQRSQTFREIEICRCSVRFSFHSVSGADNFQDVTFSLWHYDSVEFVFIRLVFMRTFYVERGALKVPIELRKSGKAPVPEMGQFPVDQLLPTNHHCRKIKLKCILPVVRFSKPLTEMIVFVRNVKTTQRGYGLRGEQV